MSFSASLTPATARVNQSLMINGGIAQAATPVRCEAATGPAPVEPQLVCYQAFAARLPPALRRWSHNWRATRRSLRGCHRPCAGGATTGVLQAFAARLPPALCRWSHNWRATRRSLRGCHRPCAGGATTGVLPGVRCEAATGPVPVEPQLACYQAFAARLPPALCRWSHNWRATRRTRQSPTVASIRIQRTGTQPRPQSAHDTATGTRPQVAG